VEITAKTFYVRGKFLNCQCQGLFDFGLKKIDALSKILNDKENKSLAEVEDRKAPRHSEE